MITDIIIIGGGASGLFTAIIAAKNGHKVTILEHMDKIGKKILVTGNGKCNLSNKAQAKEMYRGNNPNFAWDVINKFNVEDTVKVFSELGIMLKEKKGYLYPNSEQASSVLEVLKLELKHLGVKIHCSIKIESIHKSNESFVIETKNGDSCYKYFGKKIILATGGMAAPETGSDGSGFRFAKEFGHNIINPVPALVGLKAVGGYFKTLAGIRTQAKIKLYVNDDFVISDEGELQITNYGISGIPVFQVSRYASKAIKRSHVVVKIDYIPNFSREELFELLRQRFNNSYKTVLENFIGVLNIKLAQVIIKEASLTFDQKSKDLNEKQLLELVNVIKEFKVVIKDTNSFSNAQVCAGGVDTKEINANTMESKIVRGLYFCGEIMDVDGACGGYNLQFAWSTGFIAGINASKMLEEEND